jgi:xanthine dehydrogenase small subunit
MDGPVSDPGVDVNGRRIPLDGVPAHTTLLDFVRDAGFTGCKEGCAEGECGACAVLVARPGVAAPTEWVAVNACLLPAAALDGQEVVTAEGLSRPEPGQQGPGQQGPGGAGPGRPGQPAALHPVQYEMAVRGGSQCGYCTPGFVCAMAAEYYRPDRVPGGVHDGGRAGADSDPNEHGPNGFDLHALSGNLCRCTGYRPIRDAAYALGLPQDGDPLAARRDVPAPGPVVTGRGPGGPSGSDGPSGPGGPGRRKGHNGHDRRGGPDGRSFVRPATLADALRGLAEYPGTVPVAGCTDWGVEVNLRGRRADRVMAVDRLPELRQLKTGGGANGSGAIELGAALTLTELERRLDGRIPLLAEMFPLFASRLIRNGATLGGNLATGSPIGDTPPALLALDASVVLVSAAAGERTVPLDGYFTGYRQSVRRPDELIKSVLVPRHPGAVCGFWKITKRRSDDISAVAVGFALDITGGVVRRARIGLGGVAATPVRAYATEAALDGQPWTAGTVRAAADVLRNEGTPMDDHRASARYRAAMLGQSLLKLYASNPEGVVV